MFDLKGWVRIWGRGSLGITTWSTQLRVIMLPETSEITMEESAQWLKYVLPVRRNVLLFGLFSICLLIWVAMFVGMIVTMFREQFGFVLNVMLVVWLFLWWWLGRVLWGRWQYYAAGRELLFVNDQQLILRRPVSILGSTDTYDMKHITPFYFSDKHHCPAFDYAFQHVYFGHSLAAAHARDLVIALNGRFFPDHEEDD
jgi:hypothetical protein